MMFLGNSLRTPILMMKVLKFLECKSFLYLRFLQSVELLKKSQLKKSQTFDFKKETGVCI